MVKRNEGIISDRNNHAKRFVQRAENMISYS
jgi:hypothetical protein